MGDMRPERAICSDYIEDQYVHNEKSGIKSAAVHMEEGQEILIVA